MLIKIPLLHQSLGPRVFLAFSLSLSVSLFLADSLEHESQLHNPGNISLFPSFTLSSLTPDHEVPVQWRTNILPFPLPCSASRWEHPFSLFCSSAWLFHKVSSPRLLKVGIPRDFLPFHPFLLLLFPSLTPPVTNLPRVGAGGRGRTYNSPILGHRQPLGGLQRREQWLLGPSPCTRSNGHCLESPDL